METIREEAMTACIGSKSRARAKKSKFSKKKRGDEMPPVEKIRRRQMVVRMSVEVKLKVF